MLKEPILDAVQMPWGSPIEDKFQVGEYKILDSQCPRIPMA